MDTGKNIDASDIAYDRIHGHECLARYDAAHVFIPRVAEDADDLSVGRIPRALGHKASDCVGAAQVFVDQPFIDQAEFLRAAPITPAQIAACLDGNAESFEITGS